MADPLTPKDGAALALPFAVAVGGCYTFAFWGYFHVDALQFIGLAEVAKLAAYPLFFLLISTPITIAWTELTIGHVLPQGAGRETFIGRFGRKHWRVLVLANLLALVTIALVAPDPWRWFLFAVAAASLSTPATYIAWVQDLLPNPKIRSIVLLQLIAIPCLAFAYGRATAWSLSRGHSSLYVDVQRTELAFASDLSSPVAYVGRLGETSFFLEIKTKRIVIVRLKDQFPLVLIRADA